MNMNRKNIELKKEDFEKYRIPISLGNWLPKARKKYIWGELEKRHPCFSEDFCFFSKDKLSKKGLISDVFVVEKSKLGHYKNESSNNKLLLDGEKVSTENKSRKLFIYICISMLVSMFVIFLISEQSTEKMVQQGNENFIKEEKIDELITYQKVNKNILDRVFYVTKENKGNIRNLSWKLTKAGELLSGTVDNLYPEVIENAVNNVNINSTKYVDKIPFFDFSISNNFVLEGEINNDKKINTKAREAIRNILQDENVEIVEEILNPYKIIINFPIEKQSSIEQKENSILIKLNNVLDKNNLYVTGFNISNGGNIIGEVKTRMELYISSSPIYKNNLLCLINDNLTLFCNQKKIVPIKVRNSSDRLISNNGIEKIIGEVNYKNGKKVLFYKNSEGKIMKKEFYNNEKI